MINGTTTLPAASSLDARGPALTPPEQATLTARPPWCPIFPSRRSARCSSARHGLALSRLVGARRGSFFSPRRSSWTSHGSHGSYGREDSEWTIRNGHAGRTDRQSDISLTSTQTTGSPKGRISTVQSAESPHATDPVQSKSFRPSECLSTESRTQDQRLPHWEGRGGSGKDCETSVCVIRTEYIAQGDLAWTVLRVPPERASADDHGVGAGTCSRTGPCSGSGSVFRGWSTVHRFGSGLAMCIADNTIFATLSTLLLALLLPFLLHPPLVLHPTLRIRMEQHVRHPIAQPRLTCSHQLAPRVEGREGETHGFTERRADRREQGVDQGLEVGRGRRGGEA